MELLGAEIQWRSEHSEISHAKVESRAGIYGWAMGFSVSGGPQDQNVIAFRETTDRPQILEELVEMWTGILKLDNNDSPITVDYVELQDGTAAKLNVESNNNSDIVRSVYYLFVNGNDRFIVSFEDINVEESERLPITQIMETFRITG